MAATARYIPLFNELKETYSAVKSRVERKVNMILSSPDGFGEPLKYELAGLSSTPVAKNFVIIYTYCKACRAQRLEGTNNCANCATTPDETVTFFIVAPHDEAYRLMSKYRTG